MQIQYEQLTAEAEARIDTYIGIALVALVIMLGAIAHDVQPKTPPPLVQPKDAIVEPFVPENAYHATVSCFSSVECHSAFCKREAGKPRGLRAAINQSSTEFGGHQFSRVYIPAYDKEYEIVPETATGTDIDIWYGSDYNGAVACGRHTLLVNFIK